MTGKLFDEIVAERNAKDKKWGEQNHPSRIEHLHYAVMGSYRETCDRRTENGTVAWADIAAEELGEAIDAIDDTECRAELVQLAAVIVAWIECIDRRAAK